MNYRQNGSKYWQIYADVIADSGQKFGYAGHSIGGGPGCEIDEFEGTRKITDLPAFPLIFHEQGAKLREEMIHRGKIYASLSAPTMWETRGPAMREKTNERYGWLHSHNTHSAR